jgi:hypothetical protein
MPVIIPSPPAESINALNNALRLDRSSSHRYLGTRDAPERWVPQKLYVAFVQDLAAGKTVVECAREDGWRYFSPQAFGAAVSAEVRIDDNGSHVVGHFAQGPQSTQALQFTQQVLEEPRFATHDYMLQLFVVPALYVFSLWLRSADPEGDWFLPLAPTAEPLIAGDYHDAARFNAILMTLAQQRMAQETPDA